MFVWYVGSEWCQHAIAIVHEFVMVCRSISKSRTFDSLRMAQSKRMSTIALSDAKQIRKLMKQISGQKNMKKWVSEHAFLKYNLL